MNQKNGYNRVEISERVEILYDNLVHGLDLIQLSEKYGIKYNTLRHIVRSFARSGNVAAQKYKRKIIEKKKGKSLNLETRRDCIQTIKDIGANGPYIGSSKLVQER